MIMDVGRSACDAPANLFRDDDEVGTLRWYRAPIGARVFPFVHYFSRSIYTDEPKNITGVGEIPHAKQPWRNGRTPRFVDGQHWCGDYTQLQYGFIKNRPEPPAFTTQRDQDGVLSCCHPEGEPIYVPSGGFVFGGHAPFDAGAVETPRGGYLFGGTAPQFASYHYAPSGGYLYGGFAGIVITFDEVEIGGVLAGGDSEVYGVYTESATGGALISGAVTSTTVYQPPVAAAGVLAAGNSVPAVSLVSIGTIAADSSASGNGASKVASTGTASADSTCTGTSATKVASTFTANADSTCTGTSAIKVASTFTANADSTATGTGIFAYTFAPSGGVYGNGAATNKQLITGCSSCGSGAAKSFTMVVSGLTNNTCFNCSRYNTTFTMTWIGSCTWQSAAGLTGCASANVQAGMSYSSGFVTVTFTGSIAQYRNSVSLGTWDCVSSVTLSKVSNDNSCNNWPSTLTINPV